MRNPRILIMKSSILGGYECNINTKELPGLLGDPRKILFCGKHAIMLEIRKIAKTKKLS